MKLIFTYANYPTLEDAQKYEQYESSINLPDEIQHLIGIDERLLGIAERVGQLTQSSLWLTCKPFDMDKHSIITRKHDESLIYDWYARTIAFYFMGRTKGKHRQQRHIFQILGASSLDLPRNLYHRRGKNRKQRHSLTRNLFPIKYMENFDTDFYEKLQEISDQLEFLLHAETESSWRLQGVNPTWVDYNLHNRYMKKAETWQKAQKKKSQKSTPKGKGKVGNIRRYGAIPGVFQGVQFRSQLEIRLATELTSRSIDWIYEKERLGQGNYLVDFYLPDHKIWIEAKGRFEARDHYLLKDVAEVLEAERHEKLYVYTSGKCFHVTKTDFEPLKRKQLWEIIQKSKE